MESAAVNALFSTENAFVEAQRLANSRTGSIESSVYVIRPGLVEA
jgi:hypothetical protein